MEKTAIDLLSEVLRNISLQSAVLSTCELRGSWGFTKQAVAAAPFHVVASGSCYIEVEGGSPVALAHGDLVILPHGHAHAVLSQPKAPRTEFSEILKENGVRRDWSPDQRSTELDRMTFGSGEGMTRLITGIFGFRGQRRSLLLNELPALIHMRESSASGTAWLHSSVQMLIDEVMSARPGFQTMLERVADIVFVQAIRDVMKGRRCFGASWLRGLADPHIAQALSIIHTQADQAWSVESLAKAVGLSRTGFSQRFSTLVGCSVMEYITNCRMQNAVDLLTGSKRGLNDIARCIGYESEVSFSKAFRRWSGISPGRYRRQAVRPPQSAPVIDFVAGRKRAEKAASR